MISVSVITVTVFAHDVQGGGLPNAHAPSGTAASWRPMCRSPGALAGGEETDGGTPSPLAISRSAWRPTRRSRRSIFRPCLRGRRGLPDGQAALLLGGLLNRSRLRLEVAVLGFE